MKINGFGKEVSTILKGDEHWGTEAI